MKRMLFFGLLLLLNISCKKENTSRVDIYLLKSFTTSVDPATTPAINITNAVLEDTPLVANQDIRFYTRSETSFTLRKNIYPTIRNFGQQKAFAVTVDNQPVYYGRFNPAYLSSITFGLATITPELSNNNNLTIGFVKLEGNVLLQQLDKRNDRQITNALKATGRLR